MLRPTAGGVVLTLKVIPRASASGLSMASDGSLRVRLHAPPVDGAANAALIEVLAKALGLPARAIAIVSGERGRTKRVKLDGVDERTVATRIARATGMHRRA